MFVCVGRKVRPIMILSLVDRSSLMSFFCFFFVNSIFVTAHGQIKKLRRSREKPDYKLRLDNGIHRFVPNKLAKKTILVSFRRTMSSVMKMKVL